MSKQWRCAIVGSGVIGEWHARVINNLPNTTLAALCDVQPARGAAMLEKNNLSAVPVYDELAKLLKSEKIDVIHIVGGGARNELLNQLAADVTGRRVVAGPTEATAAGNALTQAMGAGGVSGLDELRRIVRRSFDVTEYRPR